MDELKQRLLALSDELAGPVRPVQPQTIRQLGRGRRRRRTAGMATLTVLLLVTVVIIPGRAAGWFGAEMATAPAGGQEQPTPLTTSRPTGNPGPGGASAVAPSSRLNDFAQPSGGEMTFRAQGPIGWVPERLASESVACQLQDGWLIVLVEAVSGGKQYTAGIVPRSGSGRSPVPPMNKVPSAGLALADPRSGAEDKVIMVGGPRAILELDERSGRAGTITGPWRITDADGRTLRDGGGRTATFTWSCPPGTPMAGDSPPPAVQGPSGSTR